jgi:hypothetical protein
MTAARAWVAQCIEPDLAVGNSVIIDIIDIRKGDLINTAFQGGTSRGAPSISNYIGFGSTVLCHLDIFHFNPSYGVKQLVLRFFQVDMLEQIFAFLKSS